MKKSSAIAASGGVVGALLSGVVGYTARMETGQSAPPQLPVKPIIKTVTSTVHVKPKPTRGAVTAPGGVSLVPPKGTTPAVTTTGGSAVASGEDDGGEREGTDD
jgi:hypothetical protein